MGSPYLGLVCLSLCVSKLSIHADHLEDDRGAGWGPAREGALTLDKATERPTDSRLRGFSLRVPLPMDFPTPRARSATVGRTLCVCGSLRVFAARRRPHWCARWQPARGADVGHVAVRVHTKSAPKPRDGPGPSCGAEHSAPTEVPATLSTDPDPERAEASLGSHVTHVSKMPHCGPICGAKATSAVSVSVPEFHV